MPELSVINKDIDSLPENSLLVMHYPFNSKRTDAHTSTNCICHLPGYPWLANKNVSLVFRPDML